MGLLEGNVLVKAAKNVRSNVVQGNPDLAPQMRVHAIHVLLDKVVHFGAELDTSWSTADNCDMKEIFALLGADIGERRLFKHFPVPSDSLQCLICPSYALRKQDVQ